MSYKFGRLNCVGLPIPGSLGDIKDKQIKIYFNVPYNEKEDAKKLNYKWDVDNKAWYKIYIEDEIKDNLIVPYKPSKILNNQNSLWYNKILIKYNKQQIDKKNLYMNEILKS